MMDGAHAWDVEDPRPLQIGSPQVVDDENDFTLESCNQSELTILTDMDQYSNPV